MDKSAVPNEPTWRAEARMSFSGVLLTDRQFNDAVAYTGMLRRWVEETGTFIDQLNDYTGTFARNEHLNVVKADSIIRDLYKIRFGESLNDTREALAKREAILLDRKFNSGEQELEKAHQAVMRVGQLVEHGTKMTFRRAQAQEAVPLARELGITHVGAKKLMEESFKSSEGASLREWGNALDTKFYRPQIEAEKRQRQAAKDRQSVQQPSFT